MTSDEALKAKITAVSNVKQSMERATDGLRDARDAMLEAAVGAEALTKSANKSEEEMEALMQAAATSSATVDTLGDELSDIVGDAVSAATSLKRAESAIEETGDEATESAASTGGFAAALQGLAAASTSSIGAVTALNHQIDETGDDSAVASLKTSGLAAALAAYSTSVTAAVGATTALVAVVSALSAAVIGVAGALALAGGALAGIFAGGLLSRGQELAAQSSEIESAWQGVAEILKQVGSAAGKALAPLQTEAFESLAIGALEAAVNLLNDVAVMIARSAGPLLSAASAVSQAFGDQSTAIFAQLEALLVEMLPYLEAAGEWLAGSLPDAIGVVREAAVDLAPVIGSVIDSLSGLLPKLVQLGRKILRVAGPAVSALLEGLTFVADGFNLLLTFSWPLIEAFRILAKGAKAAAEALNTINPLGGADSLVDAGVNTAVGAAEGAVAGGVAGLSSLNPYGVAASAGAGAAIGGTTAAVSSLSGGGSEGGGGDGVGRQATLQERIASIKQDRSRQTTIDIGPIDVSGSGESSSNVRRAAREAAKQALREERQRERGLPQ